MEVIRVVRCLSLCSWAGVGFVCHVCVVDEMPISCEEEDPFQVSF